MEVNAVTLWRELHERNVADFMITNIEADSYTFVWKWCLWPKSSQNESRLCRVVVSFCHILDVMGLSH
jgi:hypothetical protein